MLAPVSPASFSKQERYQTFLLLLAAAGMMAHLTWQLSENGHPWERVLTIDSALDDEDYVHLGSHPAQSTFDISPDDQHFITARPDGTCEIWDLNSLTKLITLATPVDFPEWQPGGRYRGSSNVHYSEIGEIFFDHDDQWRIYTREGLLQYSIEGPEHGSQGVRLSPDGKLAAYSDRYPKILRIDSDETIALFESEPISWMNPHFEWFDGGQFLMYSDVTFVSVLNTETWQPMFLHRELDLRLPPPMIAENRFEEVVERRKWGAILVDSQLAAGKTRIASLYQSADFDGEFVDASSDADRLRFYDAKTGELLVDRVLPYPGRSLAISPDGSTVFVLSTPNFTSVIRAYVAASGDFIREHSYNNDNFLPANITPLPDNRHVVGHHTRTWIVDTTGQLPDLKLHGWPSNVPEVEISTDGKTIVTVQNTKNADVWKQRRAPSRFGALVRWEYLAIHALGIASICGILFRIGRNTETMTGTRIPKQVWTVGLLLGLSLGLSIGSWFCEPVLFDFYQYLDRPTWGKRMLSLALNLFWLFALIRLFQFRNAWRKFIVFVMCVALVPIVYYVAMLVASWNTAVDAPATIPFTFSNGWRARISVPLFAVGILPAVIVVLGISIRCLSRASTRKAFERFATPAAPASGG